MKILHLSNTPLSNAPSNIAECQNYLGHNATVLLHRKQNVNKVFVGGTLWNEKSLEELVNIFETADLIHFHNYTWNQQLLMKHPALREIARRKPRLVQFHSPRDGNENFEQTVLDESFVGRRAVIAQYHVRVYPECEFILPNCLPIHKDPYIFAKQGSSHPKHTQRPLVVNYAPSNTHLKRWDYKGHDQIAPVLQKLAWKGLIVKEVVTNKPYEECLALKAWSNIGIEEFFTGSYHLSFLEYLAFGCATVGYLDDLTQKAMAAVIGEEAVCSLPYVECRTAQALEDYLIYAARYPEETVQLGAAGQAWLWNYWNPKSLAQKYIDVYERII